MMLSFKGVLKMIPLRDLVDQSFDIHESADQSSWSSLNCSNKVLEISIDRNFDRLSS